MEMFNIVGTKKLRCGYTTGTCAAGAAKAAAVLLLTHTPPKTVCITTPKGHKLELAVQNPTLVDGVAQCAIVKDSGDDPDITNGILVLARVSATASEITIDGGEGVGRVTREGLECPVGAAAINRVPRSMITAAVREAAEQCGYNGGMAVEIIIPKGAELAHKTYNPRLGIVGGISVLGTSGIVEPMSEQALIDSIKVEMNMLKADGAQIIAVTPGNYGEEYLQNTLHVSTQSAVKCSNFIGAVLDYAVVLGFSGILLVGHLGKFVKLAGGVFQTHSQYADCRMEVLAAHSTVAGGNQALARDIMQCITTDEAWEKIISAGLDTEVTESLLQKIEYHAKMRTGSALKIGAVVFTNKYGTLGITSTAQELIGEITEFYGGK